MIYVRSSNSQQVPAMTGVQNLTALTNASPALYRWPIPVHILATYQSISVSSVSWPQVVGWLRTRPVYVSRYPLLSRCMDRSGKCWATTAADSAAVISDLYNIDIVIQLCYVSTNCTVGSRWCEQPGVSGCSDYTIATKLQAGQGWHSRIWLCLGPALLSQSTCWFNVMHELQDWINGLGRLGVSQPKPFVYASPVEIQLLLTI